MSDGWVSKLQVGPFAEEGIVGILALPYLKDESLNGSKFVENRRNLRFMEKVKIDNNVGRAWGIGKKLKI